MAKQKIQSSQLTYEDYLQFPDDGKRHEIIEGVHYVSSDEKTITLAVPSKLVKDIVTERYLKPINEKLKGLVGKSIKLTITINPSLTPGVETGTVKNGVKRASEKFRGSKAARSASPGHPRRE